ncbi:septum formation initiator family protein [Streptomyces sp. JJ66]|uniref:FtsB family cell division protein n=1 Tax=Streptomyces sp. JJ66 TaxID=2803843 RepID=UPI001C580155|nr:septum formation initiator family protein [Streptomyces sp. JJ66]MBW1602757.1 septum formation initiator family protein [Streptomyces sp. JJ66]
MAPKREPSSTTTRLKALGEQAAAHLYRAENRRLRRTPRRGRLTGRAALLALVLCSLIVALAYPIRQYVSQRAEIAELREEAGTTSERVEELRELKARLQDPAYVEQLAREHLHYVRPGERGYVVEGESRPETHRPSDDAAADRPWYRNFLDGVDRADRAEHP